MSTDPIPTNFPKLSLWCANYSAQIALAAEILGLSAQEVAEEQAFCANMVTAIAKLEAQNAVQLSLSRDRETTYTNDIGALRKRIAHNKTNPAMTAGLKALLDIAAVQHVFDDTNYTATLTADIFAGAVRLKFKKLGADGVSIYHRKKGDTLWLFLAKLTKSPYDDHITLATPGQPEHWEYRCFGVVNDKEIGQPTNIIEIVFGG